MRNRLTALAVLTTAAVLVACGVATQTNQATAQESMEHASPFADLDRLVAVLHPTEGNEAQGVVYFEQTDGGVAVTADISGLEPNSRHGFHIHEYGDCTAADGTSAGGHYDPEGHPHALPNGEARHAGDLGNLETDDQGNATLELTVENVTLADANNPILGRGLIVHAQEDDGGQPTGNAGARLGCGVIGVAQPEQ
ncbi:MAG: superoxide dismutase family protein [Phycisphaeraceae bacterium]